MNAINRVLHPQLGVMLHITPQGSDTPTETYEKFTHLVQTIETLGYDEAWVTEHHFTPNSLTPAPLLMMGHFLAKTETIRLGSAAVLLGFHNPIEVAEQLAVLNTLHPNRVACGFAKGGPFESQNAIFKSNSDLSRARMEEAVPALINLLQSDKQTHQGEHYQWSEVGIHPQSEFKNEQFLLATSNTSTLRLAAKHNLGLMAAQFASAHKLEGTINEYQQLHPKSSRPDIMAARGIFIDDEEHVAQEQALRHIRNLRKQKSKLWGQHKGPMHNMDDEQMISRMLCGTVEQVQAQTKKLLHLGVTRIGLNPLTTDHRCRIEQLERFYKEVWPICLTDNINQQRAE